MVSIPSRPDVVVIGAGAAGIAAGRELQRRQVPFVILEARDRLGGRAWTESVGGQTLDFGCEWLHSADRNVLATLAVATGTALDKATPPWRKRNRQVGFDFADQDDFDGASEGYFRRLGEAGAAAERSGRDGAASELLEPGNRWNGLLDAISTYYNGAPLDRVSILDFDRYVDTEVNWRVAGGYGGLIATLGHELPIKLGCAVTGVDAADRTLRLATSAGTIETDRLIVTVPTSVLVAGAIRFDPPLDDHMAAAAGLPLGIADKLFFTLDAAEEFAPDTRLLGGFDRTDVGSYTLRARGQPMVDAYFGGDYARSLEKGGLPAFAEAATREITAALGRDIGARLRPLAADSLGARPFRARFLFACVAGPCGCSRQAGGHQSQERIVFAGEATSPHFFSTAHGAWEEGEKAARRLIAAGRAEADPAHR